MIFVSRYGSHRFVLSGTRVVRDREGFPTGDIVLGKAIEFSNHRYVTEDADEIAFLTKQLGPDIAIAQNPEELLPFERQGAPVGEGLSTANVVERQIRCEICGKAFKQKQHLHMHMKTHAGQAVSTVSAAEGAAAAGGG